MSIRSAELLQGSLQNAAANILRNLELVGPLLASGATTAAPASKARHKIDVPNAGSFYREIHEIREKVRTGSGSRYELFCHRPWQGLADSLLMSRSYQAIKAIAVW